MLNLDVGQRVVIDPAREEWAQGSQAGVWTVALEADETINGRATHLVRLDPGATLVSDGHGGGEEMIVLDGTISDGSTDYDVGSYVRAAKGLARTLSSESGCTVFVKLHQFADGDTENLHVRTSERQWFEGQGNLQVMPLHSYEGGSTALVHWPAGEHFRPHVHVGGEEILVLRGEFIDEHGRYPAGTWIRSPHMSRHDPHVEVDTTILVKVGHLHQELQPI